MEHRATVLTEAKMQQVWETFEEEGPWEQERQSSSGRKNALGLKKSSFDRLVAFPFRVIVFILNIVVNFLQ